MSARTFIAHPLVLRRVSVARITDVTPRMRRVTLSGEQLGSFERNGLAHPPFRSPMFDDHVKLLFATDGPIEDVLPHQLAHGIEWPAAETRAGRDYTPRYVREGELDLDFVMHADGHDAGPAEAWARSAQAGDDLWFVGPKSSSVIPDDADRVVLIGDETALPAIGRFLEERPLPLPVRAVILIADDSARQTLALRDDDHVEWLLAEPGDVAGTERALAALGQDAFTGTPYVWAAAESRALLPLRRALARVHRVPKSHQDITGYWHARGDEAAVAPDSSPEGRPKLGPVPSPVAWFAVRAALRLGLLDALDERPCSSTDLAARLDIAPGAVESLIAVLVTHGVLARRGDELRLSDLGTELCADEHERERFDGPEADQVMSLRHLDDAIRTGDSAWRREHGSTVAELARTQSSIADELREHSDSLMYLMPALIAAAPWNAEGTLSVHGPGAAVVGQALRDAGTATSARMRDRGADSQIHARALAHLTDEEAVAYLTALSASELIVIEATKADLLDPHAADHQLLQYAITGAAPRTSSRLVALAARAGWEATSVHELGWGVSCLLMHRSSGHTAAHPA
ncbi:MAG: siderophore-interacting protein [Microbacterium sp.]|nr:siderophore-interacting protein [Microbacterium sp.]